MIFLENEEVEMFGKFEHKKREYGCDMYIVIGDKRYYVRGANSDGYHVVEVMA